MKLKVTKILGDDYIADELLRSLGDMARSAEKVAIQALGDSTAKGCVQVCDRRKVEILILSDVTEERLTEIADAIAINCRTVKHIVASIIQK